MSIFEDDDDLDFGEGESDDDLAAAGIGEEIGPFDDEDFSEDD